MGGTATEATGRTDTTGVIALALVTTGSGSTISAPSINPIEIIIRDPTAAITTTVEMGIQDVTITEAMIGGITAAITIGTVMEDIHLITIITE